MEVYARRISDWINFDFAVSMVLRSMLLKCDQFIDKENKSAQRLFLAYLISY